MNVIVTGGAGFIGSHLVDRLIKDKHQVTIIDSSEMNIARNLKHITGKATVYCEDINNHGFLEDLGLIKNFDVIVHLAALADIVPSIENPMLYHQANVSGTISVLEFARKNNVKKFIYAASGSCYGDKPPTPTLETAPMDPKYPYALTKMIGEQYALHYKQVYGLPVTSVRFFNVYGPRSRTTGAYGAVFGVFLAQKLSQVPYTIVGDGHQSRDFIYVSDAVEGIIKAIDRGVSGEIYNICSGHHTSIRNLVNLLGCEFGAKFLPKRPGEPQITCGSVKKAQEALFFNVAVDLASGVKLMLENIDYWKDAPVWDEESINGATKAWFKYLGEKDARKL